MKTVSEQQQEIREARIKAREEERQRNERIIADLVARNIPVYINPNAKDPDADAERTRKWREEHRNIILTVHDRGHGGSWAGVACDHCRTEMWRESGMRLSMPPCQQAVCPGCGWTAFISTRGG